MERNPEVTRFIEEREGIVRSRLNQIRDLTERYLPEARECIKYGVPTLVFRKNLFFYSGYPKHIGIYPTVEVLDAFRERLKGYPVSKGGFQISHQKEMPLDLLEDMLKFIHQAKIESGEG